MGVNYPSQLTENNYCRKSEDFFQKRINFQKNSPKYKIQAALTEGDGLFCSQMNIPESNGHNIFSPKLSYFTPITFPSQSNSNFTKQEKERLQQKILLKKNKS